MEKIKIKQVKSRINCPAVQKKTLDALGLKKLNSVVAVSYTHLRGPRDRTRSRMPSSA